MAKIDIKIFDRTLAEVDKVLEKKQEEQKPRKYLGMSAIGEDCRRKLFYSFRYAEKRVISASGIKAIQDGFFQEDVMAERLRMVPGIELFTLDPETNQQVGFSLLLGHFKGHCDGIVTKGITEAPKTPHVWEHKSVGQKKFDELKKLREKHGEKKALEHWDIIYYSQAIIYMHEAQLERHFLTVTSPGGRDYISVRTDYNKQKAENLIAKAKTIIFDNWSLPARISEKREFYKCSWCEYKELCFDGKFPLVNCKTCRYMEPVKDGQFHCHKNEKLIDDELLFKGCKNHIYNPALIQAEFIEHQEDGCLYKYNDFIFGNFVISGLPEFKGKINGIYTSQMLRDEVQFLSNLKPQESAEKPETKKWDKRFKI